MDGSVYDQIFSTDGGKLALQTDLDLNGHSLNGFTKYDNFFTTTNNRLTLQSDLDLNSHSIIGLAPPPKRQHMITGIYKKSLNKDVVLFYGSTSYVSMISLKITKWSVFIYDIKSSYNRLSLFLVIKSKFSGNFRTDFGYSHNKKPHYTLVISSYLRLLFCREITQLFKLQLNLGLDFVVPLHPLSIMQELTC